MSTTLIREDRIRDISDALAEFEIKVRNRNTVHLLDVNTTAEDFICGLFNRIYGYSLHNLNSVEQQNYPGIDLGSVNDGVAVQVTSDGSRDKIQHTIDVFSRHNYYLEYPRLVVFIIGKKKSYSKNFETSGLFSFDQVKDIIDIPDLIKDIKSISNTEEIVEIAKYIHYELGIVDCNNSPVRKRVEQEYKSVNALCISKMTSLGISREQALQLLRDDLESKRFDYILDSGDTFLVGDYGTGKSHALYVLFIKQFEAFRNNETLVIPRYASIRDIVKAGGIEKWADSEWLDSCECLLILDGLDEVEYQDINRISNEVEYMAERYRNCRIIIGSRQLSLLTDSKHISIKNLDDANIDRIYHLITKLDDSLSVIIKHSEHTGNSYMGMLNRPFFLLLYCILREERSFVFSNEIDIINAFIEKSIGKHVLHSSDKDIISRFATQAVNNNLKSIHETDIESNIDKNALLRSGLVIRDRNGFYSFPLPIMAQWMAASALKSGMVDVTSIVRDRKLLMTWRYPISVYFSIASFTETKGYFADMIIHHPGISGMIINDGIKRSSVNYQEDSRIAGEKLQYCMEAWVRGTNNLLKLLEFTQDGINPNSLRVFVNDSLIKYSWARKRLEYSYLVSENIDDYDTYRWQITRSMPQQSTWPWIITYETIKNKLKIAIEKRELIISGSQLENEFIWKTALEKKKYGTLFYDEILIGDLMRFCPEPSIIKLMNNKDRRFYEHIIDLNDKGIVSIRPPFPVGDRKELKDLYWIWNVYSKNQMLKRIQFEFKKGIVEYNKIVEAYFSEFEDELSLYVVQPAKIVGQLHYDDHIDKSNWSSHPTLTTYILPMSKEENTVVDISYGNVVEFDSEEIWKSIKNSINKYRFDNLDFVYCSIHDGICFDATATPVTDWVYDKLKDDLKKICWID